MQSLFQNIKKKIVENTFYNIDFLKSSGTSDQFFKQISYPVQLDDLYRIKETCYYHEHFDFCPVMVEIVDQRLKDHYGGNFLMQVWTRDGEKTFEKTLQYDVHSWNVFTDHFVYRLHPDEAGAEWIFIHNMRKKAGVFKVKDFVIDDRSFKYLGVCNSCFYIANSNTIKCIDINKWLEDGGETVIEPAENEIATFQIGDQCKLHGFCENQFAKEQLYMICLVETEDNQIDFARLYFWSRIIEKADFSFIQYTEVVHRDVKLDPITKYRQIYKDTQFQFGMALRDSGLVDFYWNSTRVSTTEEFFTDIEINFEKMYLIKRDGTKFEISTSWDTRVSLEVAEEVQISKKDWEKIFYRSIARNFAFYPSFCLINTSFFLAHGNIISLFDIIKKQWVKHFPVEEKVLKVFRNEKSDHEYNLGAYLDNGRIKLIDSEDTTDPELWEMKLNKYGTQGTLISMGNDIEHYRMIYILTNDQGTINLYGFTRETLYILNTLVHDIREDTIIVPFFSPEERTEFILYNKEPGDVRVYTHYWEDNADGVLTFYLTLKKHYTIAEPSSIVGKVHAAMTTDKEKYLFLIDESNFYKIDVNTKEVKTYENQNVQGIQFLDNTYCYTMSNKSEKRGEWGFYVYDIQQLLDQEKDNNFILDKAIVGANGLLDFSSDNQRLSYMQDYDVIQIVPSLHRNVINFMGMLDRSKYIATKKMKDKFIALDRRNKLTTWSSITGKLEQVNDLKDIDLSSYEIFNYEEQDITYRMDWYQPRALLKQIETIENMTDDQFYDAEMLRTSLENNKPYIKILGKTFHNFKMIEIMNEYEVKEHFTFVHAFYGKGNYQRIYFSDDMEYMMERLINQRIFLYKKEKSMFGRVKWRMVRRLVQWPMDISELTYSNYLVSPDLMYYLDYDRRTNEFVIKHTLTQKVKQIIPTGLMNPAEGDVKEYAQHFKWINSQTIRIVNKEGVEKIVDIEKGFNEIAYCAVPLFDQIKGYSHFYFKRQSLEIGQTEERLKIKYQKFKAAYYLEGKRQPWQIYDQLFDIDYSVDECKYKYVIDLSFTYLHWKMAETIKNTKGFTLDEVDNSQIKKLVYNIFPWCNTALHYGALKQDIMKQIYYYSEIEGEQFEVPFLNNLDSASPMHLCMSHKEFKTADLLFDKLSDAPLDHHSRAVVNTISIAIDQGLQNVDSYIDKRFKQTQQIQQIRRGCLNLKDTQQYVCTESQIWMDVKEIEKSLFRESPVEQDIRLEFLDLPKLHCYGNKVTDSLFDSLSNTKNIDLFANRGIQTIIDYKWKLAKEYTIKKLFVPFIFFMILYFIYSNYIFVERFHETEQEYGNYNGVDYTFFVLGPLILLVSSYFLVTEVKQLFSSGIEYLFSIWNYFDLLPPIIIPLIVIQDFLRVKYDFQHTLHSIASLFMWFKFLYFLRIYKETGYLIRMIVEVIKDMKVFFVVLIIVLAAFGDAFLSLSNANPEGDARFAGDNFFTSLLYSYRTSLGDFQVDEYANSSQSLTVWIMFLFSSVLVLIVMLNLLIAIISESFAKINEVANQASYQERARIISENCYLIPADKQVAFADKHQYMLVAREVKIDDDVSVEDDHTKALDSLKEYINGKIDGLESSFSKKLDEILTLVKKEEKAVEEEPAAEEEEEEAAE